MSLRIDGIEVLHADAGWKTHGFVKLTTDDGYVGWGEFSDGFGRGRAGAAIARLADSVVGLAAGSPEVNLALHLAGQQAWDAQQAVGAVHNALLDVRARALDVPVHELLGGALRDQVQVYWGHCGTYRVTHADLIGEDPVRTLDDLVRLGRQVAERGYTALKANPLRFDDGGARRYKPDPAEGPVAEVDETVVRSLREQLAALREGTGPNVELLVDIGTGFGVPAAQRLAAALAPFDVSWLEVEGHDAGSLRRIRDSSGVPVASGERLRRMDYRALLDEGAADVAIVDVPFNGMADALRIAGACGVHDIDVAPHNCYSPLATMMSAAFCALVPNVRLMEVDVDAVRWEDDFVTVAPDIEDGYLRVPTGPGWGTEIDEAAVREHAAMEPVATESGG